MIGPAGAAGERAVGSLRGQRPLASVEFAQHGAAPIAQPRRRNRSVEVDAERHGVGQREFADETGRHAIGETRIGRVVRGYAPQRARDPRKEHEQHRGEGYPLREHPERHGQRRAPAAGHGRQRGRPRKRLQRAAEEDNGRNRRRRGEQRLAVEERRDDQQAREAHDQGSIACAARLEVLDADQREQEGDAGIAADEIAHRFADRDRGDERKDTEHPGPDDLGWRPGTSGSACEKQEAQTDERQAEAGDPGGTNASIGSCVASSSEPSHRIWPADSVSSGCAGGARRCLAKKRFAARPGRAPFACTSA